MKYQDHYITDYCEKCNSYTEQCVDYQELENGTIVKDTGCTECGNSYEQVKKDENSEWVLK